ncbi:hypothetical protein BT96DRAFT_1004261 [Gymnopus androsaceus JB14]|uniref:Uncharacterized protein n=1 Tax=Gymnopus androsaceus JB14 TaxID=1447944 RepID=A0A6A4GSH5_9AGAR|nr:hypothetical protein BT96DRAFT_1004261 [Gymnopus androsaceus JB14]
MVEKAPRRYTLSINMECLWNWFIEMFGDESASAIVPVYIVLSVVITVMIFWSFEVSLGTYHNYYSCLLRMEDIQTNRNYWLVLPIAILAILRLPSMFFDGCLTWLSPVCACGGRSFQLKLDSINCFTTGAEMTDMKTFPDYKEHFRDSSLGLPFHLRLTVVIDTLILNTLQNGAIMIFATIPSMLCWLCMDNLVFMEIYFVKAKY